MGPIEFNQQYLGSFTTDQRQIDLYERLKQYYNDTPDSMSNATAMPYFKDFKQWCRERGYTQDEINSAKRNLHT
jgi:hypothetical protein